MKTFPLYVMLVAIISCASPASEKAYEQLKAKNDSIEKAIAVRLAEENKPWKLNTFVDDFGDKTGKKFIETKTEGLFSNSATSGSPLYVKIILEKAAAGIFLYEYSADNPAVKFIGTGTIKLKNSIGETLTLTSTSEWNQRGGIALHNDSYEGYPVAKLREFIKKSAGEIKVVIKDEYSSIYSFSIDVTGFTEEYEKL